MLSKGFFEVQKQTAGASGKILSPDVPKCFQSDMLETGYLPDRSAPSFFLATSHPEARTFPVMPDHDCSE
jgi:hypothetical protein